MEQYGITAFDIIVVVIIVLSTIVALSRGFVSEVLSISAWIGAGAVTYFFFAPTLPIVQEAIPNMLLAEAVTVIVLFLVPLIVFRVISGLIARSVGGGALGFIDNFLGFGFGLARGGLLVAAAYLILSAVIAPDRQPSWVQTAWSLPYVQQGSDWLEGLLPEGFIEDSTTQANRAIDGANELREAGEAYSDEANEVIDQLVDQTQGN